MSKKNHTFSNKLIAASVLVTSSLYLSDGLELPEKLGGLKAEAASTTYYETKTNLHMRSKGSMNGKILATIPRGKQVTYLSKSGNWYKIQYGTKSGYVSSHYLNKVAKAYTTTANVNLRAKASTNSSVLATVPKGKNITYLSKSGSWYKVKYGSRTGYVSAKYVKVSSSSSKSKQTAISATKYKTTANLNLRSEASTSGSIYLRISKGKVVTATAKSGFWYKVTYGGKTGWVSGAYLKEYNTTTATGLTYYATKSTSKLYKSASTSSKAAYSIKSGNVFESTQKVVTSKGETWYRVKYKGSYYYIQSGSVKKITKKSFSSTPYKADSATSLYGFAGIAHSKIASIPKGATVKATFSIGDWYKVTYGSKTGYVDIKSFSKQTSEGTSITATTYKTTANLNMRASASTSGKILTLIPKGKVVTATAKSGNWYKVSCNGLTGWVSGNYVTEYASTSSSTSANSSISNNSYVTVAYLNIRKAASTSSAKLGLIPEGTTITANSASSGWYKVTYGGVAGYVSGSYLVPSGSASASPESTSYMMMDLRTESSVTAAQINQYISKYANASTSVLYGKGDAFISAGKKYGVNALYLAAHAIHESNYGKSTIAKAKNNLFGFGAYDSSPFVSAVRFSSVESCIHYFAQEMKATYLNPSSWKYKGAYLGYTVKGADGKRNDSLSKGMNFYYASDSNWGKAIAEHMENILTFSKEGAKTKVPNMAYPARPSYPSGSDSFPSGTLAVAKTSIKLYSSKGSSSVAATINSGKSFCLVTKYNDFWFKVTHNGRTYYTNNIGMTNYSRYMSVKNLARVSATSLNVRSKASTSGSVIGRLSNFQYVRLVLDSNNTPVASNGWYKVSLANGTVGWCDGSYLLRLLND